MQKTVIVCGSVTISFHGRRLFGIDLTLPRSWWPATRRRLTRFDPSWSADAADWLAVPFPSATKRATMGPSSQERLRAHRSSRIFDGNPNFLNSDRRGFEFVPLNSALIR